SSTAREDKLAEDVRAALAKIGRFYRTIDGTALFFRETDRRLYEISDRSESEFGRFVTYLTDLSVKRPMISRALDRLRARVGEQAELVEVHGLADNSADCDVVAINDFGGGMWYRKRGGDWEWKPNGSGGILFWTPGGVVEPWKPEFTTVTKDEDHLRWFLDQPHFADDVLTGGDQRMLLRALLLSPFFPSRNRTRPVQAHLGLRQQRQHDTGKTTAG